MIRNTSKILIVDDESFYIDVLVDLLKDEYRTVVAKDGEQALRRALASPPPDLILLDILMPNMNGHEVCRRLKADPATRDIPVIFLTIKSEVADELKGFELGAADYITKPMSPPIVRARIKTHLALCAANRELADQNNLLESRVRERTAELSRTKDVAIYCMASLAEAHHAETGKHILRTQHYVKALAEHLRHHPSFAHYLDDNSIEMLFKTSPLHDIGKVGVPDRVLLKPGRLDPDEWELMKQHAQHGHDALLRAERELGTTDFLQLAREIAHTHHERWDGTGYPRGLAGEEIPISGRLMALADVYDALISKRVYKDSMTHEAAVRIIRESGGSHLDPEMVAAFLEIQDVFLDIAVQFPDNDIARAGSPSPDTDSGA
ncbi:response regulator [Imhoffiella purpurea]|uniref:Response regulator n=1 Tax=Imhoffiella purpurea TaxID=1249627 RepID=W9VBQ8_9GAMM|nr:two-component system response regulator [Imhoffiella purpurea]EXJ13477.1 Response regulator [Imhoffiella purpurea]